MSSSRRRILHGLAAIAAAILVLSDPQPLNACGPFFERAVFTTANHPDFPLKGFALGTLGIVQPTYARSYLIIAYRYFTGTALTADDATTVERLWHQRMRDEWPPSPVDAWLKDRKRVLPAESMAAFPTNRLIGQYDSFENCLPDAFQQASRTLDRLTRTIGPASPATVTWIRAQDAVFSQCSEAGSFPAPLLEGSSAAAVADRDYQIAAAHFYAGNFDEAAARFRKIAADNASPWHTLAPYLVARTLIRKGTLKAGEGEVDRAALSDAEAQLRAVIADPAERDYHRSANALVGFVRFRLDPAGRMRELAADLSAARPGGQSSMAMMVNDLTILLDKSLDNAGFWHFGKFGEIPAALRTDAITDWVLTFQATDRAALDHAWTQWQSTHAVPWLIAAVAKVPASDPRAKALRDAAAEVPSGSAAFVTAAYHAARLAAEAGDVGEARTGVDQLLTLPDSALPGTSRNHLLALRMRLSSTFEEWLTFALRRPVFSTSDEDGMERPETDPKYSRFLKLTERRMFDDDAASVFRDALPLARWIEAGNSGVLPARLQRDIALAGWTRAALLGDETTALALAPIAGRLEPEIRADLSAYVQSPAGAPRQLSAIATILRFPGARPLVAPGLERDTAVGRIDSYRENWWCAVPAAGTNVGPAFLAPPERQKAADERARLVALGTAPTYLGREAVRLARLLPNDPRAPEVLHLAVRATRYGCTGAGNGTVSKAAFDLLHQKYPTSEWAKKTPFWFKD